jgi:hypothetical protein
VSLVTYNEDIQKDHRSRTAGEELTLVPMYLTFGNVNAVWITGRRQARRIPVAAQILHRRKEKLIE